jgi:O-acetyl-ADP-ribose deacetylase (regulator of RNase III)
MKIEILLQDITTVKVDAIVNAANSSLLGGGGVDGAIHRAGGATILEACRDIRNRQGKCKTGEAVITTAGRLPAKKVIHTVGPVYNGGRRFEKEKQALTDCYKNSLKLAEQYELESIAFPNISTGIYRFPKALAAEIAIETVKKHEGKHINTVLFVCFDDENYQIYKERLKSIINH